ncbi:hypothetical protein [Thiolinea disciformis]|uniref:hypothetical protein n=1 Tax=Thiolinea disciformis TaxID=125614 RepID=UPI00037EE8FC|nr:hypothetical protein [Thiolinea disciformis]
MALPTKKSQVTFKPRELILVDGEHYPNGRVIGANLWADVSCSVRVNKAQLSSLPSQIGAWDNSAWLASSGISTGWQYRLAKVGNVRAAGNDFMASLDVEAHATTPVTGTLSAAWPFRRCPDRDGFSLTPIYTFQQQQFSSKRSRLIPRAAGQLEKISGNVRIDPTEFQAFLNWWQVLCQSGLPAISAPWLALVSNQNYFKFSKPWEATRQDYWWDVKFEGVTCGNV